MYYLVYTVKDDNGEFQNGIYMKDKSLIETFNTSEIAHDAAHSLRKLLGKKNECIVRVLKLVTVVNFDR